MTTLLIVDDEKSVRYAFERTFGDEYSIRSAENGEQAIRAVAEEEPAVVLMDIRMPGMDGLTALKSIKKSHPHLPVIMVTAFADSASAMQAMKDGAFDYVAKPFDNDELRSIIAKALNASKMQAKLHCGCGDNWDATTDDKECIVGSSPEILNMCKKIGQVAGSDLPVLITGETGVGKELTARAIYQHSTRNEAPFMIVNCASLPDELVESELFGYETGAFTGAVKQRIGRFEQCTSGTLFLDEIGELPLAAQAKVLRVLQDGTFERLGSNKQLQTDVRLIAATNRNLEQMATDGRFRADLLHRINVLTISIPPLRQRISDLPDLILYFLARYGCQVSPPVEGISDEALKKLASYHWPGNIRELENTIRRAIVLAKSKIISAEDCILPQQLEPDKNDFEYVVGKQIDLLIKGNESRPYRHLISEVEQMLIKKALDLCDGNQVKAANLLGINRMTLRKKLASA
ncbi:sigma-54-dependent Fis family transcriptional regulator [Desulfolithobacter dissulfuricans]|uniref:DNA-binding transcriptional regulator NtrC n=1 Tax=Desulfolithobacter dissulfuricans TaxID=2795293 RepID=A0A915U9E0_9BACT|nr:sigma-54 dependent transcriptional regulator [Desulfolithobacter dissulfuricans]BCO08285.1 sigma-54-dependent Fis family transcriptional regulator [Desulfolithobacter dissulfuricans]